MSDMSPPSRAQTHRQANITGSLWMVLAMACFALEDVLIKALAAALPIAQILILFGAGGALMFAILARARDERLYSPQVLYRPMRIRVVFEILGRLFYVLAIALAPLSSATAILQATPIVVVAGAAIFFGEIVGWRRWAAICVGLIGVLIILRPTSDSFTIYSVLAVLGMLGFAGRDLASRAAPASLSTSILGLYGFLSVIVAGGLFTLYEDRPFGMITFDEAPYVLGAVICGVVAYGSLMNAMRTGEVSTVTPFRYTRLLFGLACGVILFHETIDLPMMVGCGLIVVSGLYIMWRGTRLGPATP